MDAVDSACGDVGSVLAFDIALIVTSFACEMVAVAPPPMAAAAAFAIDGFDCAIGLDHCHKHRTHSFADRAAARMYLNCSCTFAVDLVATSHTANRRNCDLPAAVGPAVAFDTGPFDDVTWVVALLASTILHQNLRHQTMVHGMSVRIERNKHKEKHT